MMEIHQGLCCLYYRRESLSPALQLFFLSTPNFKESQSSAPPFLPLLFNFTSTSPTMGTPAVHLPLPISEDTIN
ncbi:Uncharacterized protein HZ326_16765 [Fusarium oxysporum f. sp. albedinis]|nr:Uncharacterized protein HZ326_16765 [Fusarium oxysporum f. sp. albedinis]